MKKDTDSLSSIERRSFVRNSIIAGAALGSVGTVQADEHEEINSHEAPDRDFDQTDIEYTDVEDAEAVLYKVCPPWESSANEDVLRELGIPYSVLPPQEAQNINDEFDIAILAATQEAQFQQAMLEARDAINEWVEQGGTLVAHMTATGWPCNGQWDAPFLPNDVTVVDGELFDQVEVLNQDHPVVEGFTAGDLSGWGSSSHGYFENLPENAQMIYGRENQPEAAPVHIEYGYGNGSVLATMAPIEYGLDNVDVPVLFNEIRYAAVGGDAPDGDSDLSLENIAVDSNINGEAAQGESIVVSATASNDTEQTISDTVDFSFDNNRSLETIDVDLNPGATTELFAELDVGTTVEPGEIPTGFATGGAQQQTAGQLTPPEDAAPADAKPEIDPADTEITLDNGSYIINISAQRSDGWTFREEDTLYGELYALQGGNGSVVSSEDMSVVDEYPPDGSPGETYSATSRTQAFGTTLEVERRVRLDPDEPVFEIEHEITNEGDSNADSISFYQYIDYDINGAGGNAGRYNVFDNGNIYQVGADGSIHSGFGSSVAPDEFDVGPFSNVRSRVLEGNLANREEHEGDVTGALKYNLGGLSPGESTTVTLSYAAGTSVEQIGELLGAGAGGGDGDGGDAIATELIIRELGDVNHDGEISISDAVFAQRGREGRSIDGTYNPAAADLNQDGTVDTEDVQQLLEKNVGNEPDIPQREPSVDDAGTR
jgi:hypothetical protein